MIEDVGIEDVRFHPAKGRSRRGLGICRGGCRRRGRLRRYARWRLGGPGSLIEKKDLLVMFDVAWYEHIVRG